MDILEVQQDWYKNTNLYLLSVEYISDRQFMPSLKEGDRPVWAGGFFKTFDSAKAALLEKYHSLAEDLVEGFSNVDVDLLYVHPKNSSVYIDDKFDDLLQMLDVENPYIAPLEITSTGRIVTGNRRKRTVDIINARARKSQGKAKIPVVPVIVKAYEDETEELRQLILNNQSRPKNNYILGLEALMLYEIEQQKAKHRRVLARLKTTNKEEWEQTDKGRTYDIIARKTGMGSRATAQNFAEASGFVQKLEAEGETELASKVKEVQSKNLLSSKASHDLIALPDKKTLEKVCDKILAQPGKTKRAINSFVEEVKAEEKEAGDRNGVEQQEAGDLTTVEGRLQVQRAKQDLARDTWQSPDYLYNDAIRVMDGIDLDPFADMTKRVPAKHHFTIVEDGFKQDWFGRIFTNFPFSKQAKCFQKLEEECRKGHIEQAIIVCESTALFGKESQRIIAENNMVYCCSNGRIGFVISEMLADEFPDYKGKVGQIKEGSRHETVILYYSKPGREKYDLFYEVFSKRGDIRYSRFHLQESARQSTGFKFPAWENDKAEFMGFSVEVQENEDGLYDFWLDGEIKESHLDSLDFARNFAIAYVMSKTNYFA